MCLLYTLPSHAHIPVYPMLIAIAHWYIEYVEAILLQLTTIS